MLIKIREQYYSWIESMENGNENKFYYSHRFQITCSSSYFVHVIIRNKKIYEVHH